MNDDLNDLSYAEGVQSLILVHPATGVELTYDGKPMVVFLQSPNSPAMKSLERAIQNKRLKIAQRTGRISFTAEEIEEETIQRLAKSITGWDNIRQGGQEVDYDHEAAKAMMRDLPWMRNQVDAFLREDANFLVTTSTKT